MGVAYLHWSAARPFGPDLPLRDNKSGSEKQNVGGASSKAAFAGCFLGTFVGGGDGLVLLTNQRSAQEPTGEELEEPQPTDKHLQPLKHRQISHLILGGCFPAGAHRLSTRTFLTETHSKTHKVSSKTEN